MSFAAVSAAKAVMSGVVCPSYRESFSAALESGKDNLSGELAAVPDGNLRHAVVVVNHSRSAYMCPRVRELPYVLSIFIPHQERESLLWEGRIQIEEGGLALAGHRGMLIAYGPADLGAFTIVRPGLSCGEGLRISDGRPDHQCDCKRYRYHGISGQIPGGRSYINPD
jgi:hypothetical protein